MALRKTVGHEHVQHVLIGKAYAFLAGFLALEQGIGHYGFLAFLALWEGDAQLHVAWLCATEVKVYEEVVGRLQAYQ